MLFVTDMNMNGELVVDCWHVWGELSGWTDLGDGEDLSRSLEFDQYFGAIVKELD